MISKTSSVTLKIFSSLFLFYLVFSVFLPTIALGAAADDEKFDPDTGIITCGIGSPVEIGPDGKPVMENGKIKKNNDFKPCTICDFFKVLARIYDFIVKWVAAPLAVLAISIGAAFMILGAGAPNLYETGKKIVKTAIIGLILIFASWLIIDFFLRTIGYKDADNWSTLDIDCTPTGNTPAEDTLPEEDPFGE